MRHTRTSGQVDTSSPRLRGGGCEGEQGGRRRGGRTGERDACACRRGSCSSDHGNSATQDILLGMLCCHIISQKHHPAPQLQPALYLLLLSTYFPIIFRNSLALCSRTRIVSPRCLHARVAFHNATRQSRAQRSAAPCQHGSPTWWPSCARSAAAPGSPRCGGVPGACQAQIPARPAQAEKARLFRCGVRRWAASAPPTSSSSLLGGCPSAGQQVGKGRGAAAAQPGGHLRGSMHGSAIWVALATGDLQGRGVAGGGPRWPGRQHRGGCIRATSAVAVAQRK